MVEVSVYIGALVKGSVGPAKDIVTIVICVAEPVETEAGPDGMAALYPDALGGSATDAAGALETGTLDRGAALEASAALEVGAALEAGAEPGVYMGNPTGV